MAIAQGREPFIGVAVETTAGTAVAAVKYLPFVTCTIRGIHEPMEDDAAKGVRERVWGAITGRQRGEGDVEIYVDVENAAYLLYPALGSISSATASGEASVFEHTITRKSGSTPKTLTVTYNDTQDTRVFPYATINTLELSVSDGLATISANIISKFPETTASTASLSITEERILAFKDYTVKFGSGATGTAALADAEGNDPTLLRSFNLRVNNNAEAVYQSGNASAQDVTVSEFEVDGDYTLFFEDTTDRAHYETLLNGSDPVRAMIVTFTGDAIGSTSGGFNEEIEIRIPNFHLTDRTIDTAISGFITENPSFFAQYDPTEAKSIQVKVTNQTASY
jgi:hypothetical protein